MINLGSLEYQVALVLVTQVETGKSAHRPSAPRFPEGGRGVESRMTIREIRGSVCVLRMV